MLCGSQPLNEVEIQRVWKEIGDPLAEPMLYALRDEITNKTRKQKNLIEAFANSPRIKQVESMVRRRDKFGFERAKGKGRLYITD